MVYHQCLLVNAVLSFCCQLYRSTSSGFQVTKEEEEEACISDRMTTTISIYCVPIYCVDISFLLYVRLSVSLYIRVSVCLSICLFICPSVHLSIYLSIRLSVHPSIHTFINPFIHKFINSFLFLLCIHVAMYNI